MLNLLLLVTAPFFAATIMFLTSIDKRFPYLKKKLALLLSLIPLVFLIVGLGSWENAYLRLPWISTLGIDFYLFSDALSLFFVALTAIIIPVAISVVTTDSRSLSLFFGLILLLQGILFILFTARDLALFTIAWEAMLLPLYFIINIWGGPKRQLVSLQFLIYMIAGSSLFVIGVLALYFLSPTATFDMNLLSPSAEQVPYATLILAAFLLAFAVKVPLFPFHAWLPEAYVEAPFAGTILLSALLSKAGIYGIARLGWGFFPNIMANYSKPLLMLAIIGTLYGALSAWTQRSIKSLVAYSSLSHVNFILAGLFIALPTAMQGSILQAFNHGITIAALFTVTYWLQVRTEETTLGEVRGSAKFFPKLCWFTLLFVLSAIALPFTNNFVGELLILFSLYKQNAWLAALLTLSVILSAIYMLRWMQNLYFEEPTKNYSSHRFDLSKKELAIALPLAAITLGIGIYPGPLLKEIEPTAAHLAEIYKDKSSYTVYKDEIVLVDSTSHSNILAKSLAALMPSSKITGLLAYNEIAEEDWVERFQNQLELEHERQRSEDAQREVDHELQRAADNRKEAENILQRGRDQRRLDEERRLARQRENRRDEERRLERQRLDRQRENR